MIDWRILATVTPVFFVIYQAFARLLPKGTSTYLAGAYTLGVAAMLMLAMHVLMQSNKSLQLSGRSLLLTLGMGAGMALGNFGILKSLSLGAPQSTFSLLFYVSLLIYGIIFGVVLWREKLQLIQLAGVALACIGLFLAVYFKK